MNFLLHPVSVPVFSLTVSLRIRLTKFGSHHSNPIKILSLPAKFRCPTPTVSGFSKIGL